MNDALLMQDVDWKHCSPLCPPSVLLNPLNSSSDLYFWSSFSFGFIVVWRQEAARVTESMLAQTYSNTYFPLNCYHLHIHQHSLDSPISYLEFFSNESLLIHNGMWKEIHTPRKALQSRGKHAKRKLELVVRNVDYHFFVHGWSCLKLYFFLRKPLRS